MTLTKTWEKGLALLLALALVTGFSPLMQVANAQEADSSIASAPAAAEEDNGATTSDSAAASDSAADASTAPANEPIATPADVTDPDNGEDPDDPAEEATSISVTYVLNGGKNASSNAKSFSSDGSLTLSKASRSGYTFAGWYLDSKFKTKVTKLTSANAKNGAVKVYAKFTRGLVSYKAKKSSWASSVAMGKSAGSGTLTGIRIYNKSTNLSGSVYYKVKTSSGWSSYVKNGATAANYGQTIRGIKVKLTGELADTYDVYYRVKVGEGGWLGWTKNANTAGTSWRKITAYQVKLVKKGSKAPGSTAHAYITKSNSGFDFYVKNVYASKVKNKSSQTKYIVIFSSTYNRCAIFKGKKGNWKLEKYWLCATGAPATPSVKGTFTVDGRGYSFGNGFTCWYWVEWYGDYLFHSETYVTGSKKRSDILENALGHNMTHGCVRLDIKNAKWMYDHIPNGTKVLSIA